MKFVARFMRDESGATAIEYGLIAALISVGIIAAATTLGGGLGDLFNGIGGKLQTAADDPILAGEEEE
jgi:pilus assembly protein Flp/PilA